MRDERVDVLKAQRDGGRCFIWWGGGGGGMRKMFHLVGGGMRKMFHLVGERDAEDVPFVTSPLSLTRIFRLVKVLTEILRALGF